MHTFASDPPHQPGLVPDAAPPRVKLCLCGQVQRAAEVRSSTDGRVHLGVQILQPQDALPFVAIRHGASSEGPDFADLAARLHPGATAIVIGRGLRPARHQGREVLMLEECDGISLAPAELATLQEAA